MELTLKGIQDRAAWTDKGYSLPEFDIEEVKERTAKAPAWIHFGGGNLFKAFPSRFTQELLNKGVLDKGIIVAEGFDYEIIEKMSRPHDDLALVVTLKSDGSIDKDIVASVTESLILDSSDKKEFDRLKEIFENPSLQMASFTITEKGYSLTNAKGETLPAIQEDFEKGPEAPVSYIGKVAALLYDRYQHGELPITLVSMDNCSHNGDKLKTAVLAYADAWTKNGLVDKGFEAYLNNPEKVAFPWTMIDKITPRPDAEVEKMLVGDNIEGLEPVITSKNTYVAPFTNAEETEYLVIEDTFPNGRPALEEAGVIFTDRDTVNKVEKMKVTTCLNPLHTALAVYGCILGYDKIYEEMKDADLTGLISGIGYDEGLPVVVNPGVLDPEEFINTVIDVRFPNPFMPDTPQRIATDTSQKLAVRFGETIKSYLREGKDLNELDLIPLVQAGWIRYLMGLNDNGEAFTLSPDPLLEEVLPIANQLSLDEEQDVASIIEPLLKNEKIFGLDLTETVLGDKVIAYVTALTDGKGAIRKTLHEAVEKHHASKVEKTTSLASDNHQV